MENNVAQQGVRTILLETAADNAGVVAFWQSHGYRIEGVLKRYYLQSRDAYEMRKLLPAPRPS
jgi:ribosomal protein S18 acetylase RimI-like enzyme